MLDERYQQGIEKGKTEGIAEGIEQGKSEAVNEIVKALLADGTPTAKIAFLTGLSENTIKRLIENNWSN